MKKLFVFLFLLSSVSSGADESKDTSVTFCTTGAEELDGLVREYLAEHPALEEAGRKPIKYSVTFRPKSK